MATQALPVPYMPATVQINHLEGPAPGVPNPVTYVRFRNDDTDNVDTSSPIALPENIWLNLPAAVSPAMGVTLTGSAAAGFVPGDYAIVEAGSTRQEVIALAAGDPGPDLVTTFGLNHPSGTLVQLVVAAFAKFFQIQAVTKPNIALADFRVRRRLPLPYQVFDQCQVLAAADYAQATSVPWSSNGTQVFSPVPPPMLAAPTLAAGTLLIWPGPLTTAGLVPSLFGLQWLFTARMVPPGIKTEEQYRKLTEMVPAIYRFSWQES